MNRFSKKSSRGAASALSSQRQALSHGRFDNPGRVWLRSHHPDELGYVDTTGSLWEHTYFGRMDWGSLPVPEPLKQAMQQFIIHELGVSAPRSVFAHFERLRVIASKLGARAHYPLSRERILAVMGALRDRHVFSLFLCFYRWAAAQGIAGFDERTLREMEYLSPPPRRRSRIGARDAQRYLTDDEQRALLATLETVPAVGDPGLRDHVLVQLTWEVGCRPDQARGIDERHLHVEEVAGHTYTAVDVPRSKQRTAPREYKRRPISPELATKILLLLTQNRTLFGASNGHSPVFRTQARINLRTRHFGGRLSAGTAARAIGNFLSKSLSDTRYRGPGMLRHNMAQRMADMGAPAAAIAEALDHSSLETVAVYVRARPDVAILKTRALGKSAAYRDVLDWLNGRTPIPRSEADRTAVVQGVVADRYIGHIGVCGLPKDKHCSYNPVYACYGCQQFTPFIDGEHGAVAQAMVQENQRLLEIANAQGNGVALANEYPIAAALAVQALCHESQGTQK